MFLPVYETAIHSKDKVAGVRAALQYGAILKEFMERESPPDEPDSPITDGEPKPDGDDDTDDDGDNPEEPDDNQDDGDDKADV